MGLVDRDGDIMRLMFAMNGQICMKPARYGGGWIVAASLIEWDFVDEFDDLSAGDNDYFDARDFFTSHKDIVFFENIDTPERCFRLCFSALKEMLPDG